MELKTTGVNGFVKPAELTNMETLLNAVNLGEMASPFLFLMAQKQADAGVSPLRRRRRA